ncbi:hypothetical protein D3C76_1625210 [compost metagenome]
MPTIVPVLPVGAWVITVTLRMPFFVMASPTSGYTSVIFFMKPLSKYFSASNASKEPFSAAMPAEARYASRAMKPYNLSRNSSDSGLP